MKVLDNPTETALHHEQQQQQQPHHSCCDIDWKEVNAEFGYHDRVPHDEHLNDDNEEQENATSDGKKYRHMVFDFEELVDNENNNNNNSENNRPIQLRTQLGISQSTGLAIWTCSQILSTYLIDHPHHVVGHQQQQHHQHESSSSSSSFSVLELGAGLGLCSIVAHQLGAPRVLATDGDVDTLENLRYNARQNSRTNCSTNNEKKNNTISCPQLVWGQNLAEFERHYQKQDVILASDLFYAPALVQPLWQTVDHLLKPNGTFLLAFAPHRVSIEHVLQEAKERGFTWACPDITANSSDEEETLSDSDFSDNKKDYFDDHIPVCDAYGYYVFHFKRA